MSSARSQRDIDRLEDQLKSLQLGMLANPDRYRAISFDVYRACMTTAIYALDGVAALQQTIKAVQDLVPANVPERAEIRNVVANSLTAEFLSRVSRGGCSMHVLRVRKSIAATDLIAAAGLANSYLASLERTLFDGYAAVAFKVSNYASFDPRSGMNNYLWSVGRMAQTRFLTGRGDRDDVETLGDFDQAGNVDPPLVRVPFSPLISSCLTTTIFFWIYLLFVFISRVRISVMNTLSQLLPQFALDKAVFTSIALIFSTLSGFLYLGSLGIGVAWTLLLS